MTRRRSIALAALLGTTLACARPVAPPMPRLGEAEHALVSRLNDLRADPGGYGRKLEAIRECFDGTLLRRPGRIALRTREGRLAVDEAVAWLARLAPVTRLQLHPGLCRAARDHARDLGLTGRRSHDGSDGSDMAARLRRYGRLVGAAGEAIAFGDTDPDDVLQSLVVDDGVVDRGHRSTLMERQFHLVGVACGAHATDGWVCVLDLAQRFDP